MAHVHYHLQDGPVVVDDLENFLTSAAGLPACFNDFTRDGESVTRGTLKYGETVSNKQ